MGLHTDFGTASLLIIGNDGVRLMSQNCSHHWPIVHPLGECECRAVVMMMPDGNNS
jgi:hypothetical protein